jgi:hypothetical protein
MSLAVVTLLEYNSAKRFPWTSSHLPGETSLTLLPLDLVSFVLRDQNTVLGTFRTTTDRLFSVMKIVPKAVTRYALCCRMAWPCELRHFCYPTFCFHYPLVIPKPVLVTKISDLA